MGENVRLAWKRVEKAGSPREADTVDEFVIKDASLVQKQASHYLSYKDPDAADARTTLKIEHDCLTMIRHGQVEWRHEFRAGEEYHSTMRIAHMSLQIETQTHRLSTEVVGDGGRLFVDYSIRMGGELKHVLLDLTFASQN